MTLILIYFLKFHLINGYIKLRTFYKNRIFMLSSKLSLELENLDSS